MVSFIQSEENVHEIRLTVMAQCLAQRADDR